MPISPAYQRLKRWIIENSKYPKFSVPTDPYYNQLNALNDLAMLENSGPNEPHTDLEKEILKQATEGKFNVGTIVGPCKLTTAVERIYDILEPLSAEQKGRVLNAVSILLDVPIIYQSKVAK